MASVHDVAKYIVEQQSDIDTWKLEKLVYYCQAWHMVWEEKPLFTERIEAWANGPVSPDLWQEHRGLYKVKSWSKGSTSHLNETERESIDVVLKHYGKRTGFALRDLTHKEAPWRSARKGVPIGAPSNNVITPDSMAAYYGSL